MTTITVEEAQSKLKELLARVATGETFVITDKEQSVARLIGQSPEPKPKRRPRPGLGRGMITFIAPGFDAPLDEMKKSMA